LRVATFFGGISVIHFLYTTISNYPILKYGSSGIRGVIKCIALTNIHNLYVMFSFCVRYMLINHRNFAASLRNYNINKKRYSYENKDIYSDTIRYTRQF